MSAPLAAPPVPAAPRGASDTARPRAQALDALRGLAILGMVFSGIIPFDRPLPRWMFHAQEPPAPDAAGGIAHAYNPRVAGLT